MHCLIDWLIDWLTDTANQLRIKLASVADSKGSRDFWRLSSTPIVSHCDSEKRIWRISYGSKIAKYYANLSTQTGISNNFYVILNEKSGHCPNFKVWAPILAAPVRFLCFWIFAEAVMKWHLLWKNSYGHIASSSVDHRSALMQMKGFYRAKRVPAESGIAIVCRLSVRLSVRL